MARRLQDRLALASYKTLHGQEGLSFDDVEANLEKTVQRRRPTSSIGTSSTSSSTSSEYPAVPGGVASSPLTVPFSSDHVRNPGLKGSSKRDFHQSTTSQLKSKPSKRIRSQSMAPPSWESSRMSWKSVHNLPESSPGCRHQGMLDSDSYGHNLSFACEVSTASAPSSFDAQFSEDDDGDLPTHSFSAHPAFGTSSPRTPPPARNRAIRQRKAGGEEGADLLLYLATSPSPANPGIKVSRLLAPSTPPSNPYAVPPSMMNTPGLTGFSTPGQNFNFADFVNVTPSPAQGAFSSRTPGPTKTPLAAKEARRRLNFDSLAPPHGSPNISNIGRGSMNKDSGLGMELGGELIS